MMVEHKLANEFRPNYASPPGETLLDLLEELDMSQAELARRTGRPNKTINEIIKGKTSITPETALQLERVLGVPASFWIRREQFYREALARQEETLELEEQTDWLLNFPIKEMISLGWIRGHESKVAQLQELLGFFGIASPAQWHLIYQETCFRQSRAFEVDSYAVAAWLRQGELTAQQIDCQPYSEPAFRRALGELRALTTRIEQGFEETLIALCASAGVAVALIPELPKTRVSGATRWLSPSKALIQLSLRYKSDDQFWFTFFHEAGHIVLHGKREIFLEEENGHQADTEEGEANRFAADTLIPPEAWQHVVAALPQDRHPSYEELKALALELGIAPGILVGRLQHEEIVPYSHFNPLKTKLEWA